MHNYSTQKETTNERTMKKYQYETLIRIFTFTLYTKYAKIAFY